MFQSIITIVCAFLAGIVSGLICKAKEKWENGKKFWLFIYCHRLWLRLGLCMLLIGSYAVGLTYILQNFNTNLDMRTFLHAPVVAPTLVCAFSFLFGYISIYIKDFFTAPSNEALCVYDVRIEDAVSIAYNSILLILFIVSSVQFTILDMERGIPLLPALNQSLLLAALLTLFLVLVIYAAIKLVTTIIWGFINWLKS